MCSSFPDVVVDQPAYHAGQVITSVTLPRTAFEQKLSVSSGYTLCQGDDGSTPSLDLVTYSETNLAVSPFHNDHRRLRVPIELADEDLVAEIGETFSPMSPLSLDSVDFVAEKVSECILSSPVNDVSVTTVPLEATSYLDVPQMTEFISPPHDGVNLASETENEAPGNRSLSSINEDALQTSGECESFSETDNYSRSVKSAPSLFDSSNGAIDSSRVKYNIELECDARPRHLQIGRCTTV